MGVQKRSDLMSASKKLGVMSAENDGVRLKPVKEDIPTIGSVHGLVNLPSSTVALSQASGRLIRLPTQRIGNPYKRYCLLERLSVFGEHIVTKGFFDHGLRC